MEIKDVIYLYFKRKKSLKAPSFQSHGIHRPRHYHYSPLGNHYLQPPRYSQAFATCAERGRWERRCGGARFLSFSKDVVIDTRGLSCRLVEVTPCRFDVWCIDISGCQRLISMYLVFVPNLTMIPSEVSWIRCVTLPHFFNICLAHVVFCYLNIYGTIQRPY